MFANSIFSVNSKVIWIINFKNFVEYFLGSLDFGKIAFLKV